MWERFGYYLMIGIFFLYMTDDSTGGMSLDRKKAADIFGTFIALVYVTPFIGGMLADRLLGYRRAIIIGGLMMGLGYIGLSLQGSSFFYASLGLIIVGNGFFKPNISTLLGNLYNRPEFKANKDSGFNIFYMGINVGAFICNFFAAYLRHSFGWGSAFLAAGVGMFIGVIVFMLGYAKYAEGDVRQAKKEGERSVLLTFSMVLIPAAISGYIGWILPDNIFGSDSTDAFLLGTIPVVAFFLSLYFGASKEEKKPIAALLAIMGVGIIFWAIFKQNGTALTTWAESYTDRQLPASIQPIADKLHLTVDIPYVKDSVTLSDEQFRPLKDEAGKNIRGWDYPSYFKNMPPDERPSPGNSVKVVSTEIFQSANPFFVVALTPLVVAFFSFLRRRKREPSTPTKFFLGLFIASLSTLVMVAASIVAHNGLEKSSALWLIGAYGVITVGELCLSPIGLSLVSKLSPPRIGALMMGGLMLSISIGNKLSGVLASMWDGYETKSNFFLVNCVVSGCAALGIFLMLKWLKRIMKEHGIE